MKLNKDFPHKLYLDTKVLVNGNKKKPRDLNLEKHIELGKWIQDMIDEENIEFSCNCGCNITAVNDYIQFRYNTLPYQFHPILGNDLIGTNISNIDVEIVDDSTLSDEISVSLFESQYYPFKIIKITRPTGESDIGNIDQIETFTYKITGTCNGESIESNVATVNILPVSVNIEQYINNTP